MQRLLQLIYPGPENVHNITSTADAGPVRKHWALHPQEPFRLIRDEEVGGSGIFLYI